jgi:hypothetical protein
MKELTVKTCFKCEKVKSLSEYYKHPKMADGHLGKCKDCTKRDTAKRCEVKSHDPSWVINEMIRHRKKSIKYRKDGYKTPSNYPLKKAWLLRNPEKKQAYQSVKKALRNGTLHKTPCIICGEKNSQAHHDDYSKPLSVKWLCSYHHGEIHHKQRISAVINNQWDSTEPSTSRPKGRKNN